MSVEDVKRELATEGPIQLTGYPAYVRGCSREILEWFSKFNDVLLEHITEFDQGKKVVLLTVCSYAKPYSHSFIHYGIRKALFEAELLDEIEYWHLSSAGVIPSCMEEEVPYCCYDWNNAHATEDDLRALREYLEDHYLHWLKQYISPLKKSVVTYFRPESNTRQAIDRVIYRPSETPVIHVEPTRRRSTKYTCASLLGEYADPDGLLLHTHNLRYLVDSIYARIGVQHD